MPRSAPRTKVETRLSSNDFSRLKKLAGQKRSSMSALVRDAVRRYLNDTEHKENAEYERPTVQAIKAMTNRVCALLARTEIKVDTLFHLTAVSVKKDVFAEALNTARSKVSQKLDEDEKRISQKMGRTMQ